MEREREGMEGREERRKRMSEKNTQCIHVQLCITSYSHM